MRKTRLVILPTKCLHQMGFLLLFLSCPVIGDWGRIRPESENSHNAIQIQREGTCGFERDPPGGLLDFLNETGSKQCRLSEDSDSIKPIRMSDERRVHVRRINQRESERRMTERRDVRSRSVESRRVNRNDVRVRSLSLSRLEDERSSRRYAENRRRETRLHMSRFDQRRLTRENEIRVRNVAERRERETRRLTRSAERERQDIRRDNTRRDDINQERMVRERLSLARREIRADNRRMTNLERRVPEIRKTRSLDFDTRREAEDRRFVSVSPKITERTVRERRVGVLNERMDAKTRRMNFAEMKLEKKISEDEKPWLNFNNYESFKTGDWTTNCVIGAVVYFFTTRQIKTV